MKKSDLLELPAHLFVLFRLDYLMRCLNRKKIRILVYHGITDSEFSGIQNYDYKHVNIKKFRQQVRYLIKYFSIISLEEFIDSKKLPNNPLILTFDDGYKNNFIELFPILKEKKISATIFLTSDIINTKNINWPDMIEFAIDKTNLSQIKVLSKNFDISSKKNKIQTVIRLKKISWQQNITDRKEIIKKLIQNLKIKFNKIPFDYQILEWKQIKQMAPNGISFGSHTKTHTNLTKLSKEELQKELKDSKKELENNLSQKVKAISYPNGYYNPQVIESTKEAGYTCGLTIEHGLNNKGGNKFRLKRIVVNDSYSHTFFIANLYFNFNKLNAFISQVYINLKKLFGK